MINWDDNHSKNIHKDRAPDKVKDKQRKSFNCIIFIILTQFSLKISFSEKEKTTQSIHMRC